MNISSKKFVTIDPPFTFKNGDIFDDPITIAYETSGVLNEKKDNAILVATGLSPSAHICSSLDDPSDGWWEEIVGEGKYIDTQKILRDLYQLSWQLLRLLKSSKS